jgi:NTE family protein
MGAERVISVYLSARWVKPGGPRHVFDIIGQCFSIAQDKMCGIWKAVSDVVVEPDIGDFGYDDFARAPELVKAGEMATRAILPQIREWFPVTTPRPVVPTLEPEPAAAVAVE